MSASGSERLEELVGRFLDLRDDDPELTPERFAADAPGSPAERAELIEAIRRSLAIAAALEAAGAELPGTVGPFRVLREIGRGGAGVVYEVERDGRRLALKRVSGAALGPHGLERFRREARLLTRLDHPGVVRVVDSGAEAGDAWLAMELVEGTPLSALARRGPLEPERAARIARDLARAVAAVHAAGVVHRDLKPDNVIVAAGDRPVLIDFGLGAADDEGSLTATGALLGTPRYMAPEQARGEAADRRTDVYALGLILAELLSGEPARTESSRTALLREIERRPVRLPRPGGGAIDADLARLLAAALAHEPGTRLGEAAAFADDLERWLAGEPVHARPPGPIARLRSFARRRPAAAGVAALAALLVCSVAFAALRAREHAARAASSTRRHLDRALAALVLGDEAWARREAEAALEADPTSLDARHLVGTRALVTDAPPVAEMLARRAAPPSSHARHALAAERARAGGDALGAARELEALTRAAPDLAPAWRALAAASFEGGELDAGLAAARMAFELEGDVNDRAGELPRLLARAPDPAAVRAALEGRLDAEPEAALWFALAWTLDAAHEIEAAERAYRNAADADARHVKARLCLAHLYSGAQLGACAGCEQAYARWPELNDPERALHELVDALAIDRGEGQDAVGRALETALALSRRGGSVEPLERMLAELERCLALGTASPQAAARLADGRTRLQGALGR